MNQYLNTKVTVQMDRPLGTKHAKFGLEYLLNYGFLPNTVQGDGEEIDAYVIGPTEPLETFTGTCIAYIERLDDSGDFKLIVVSDDKLDLTDEEILEAVNFQEQWFKPVLNRS